MLSLMTDSASSPNQSPRPQAIIFFHSATLSGSCGSARIGLDHLPDWALSARSGSPFFVITTILLTASPPP